MEYNRIQEEAQVNEMILEKANEAATDAYDTAEETIVNGYQAIENGVVGGYKKVENAFVSGWEKVEDACVDALFKKEGETTEQAKERLSRNAGAHKVSTNL